MKSESTEIVAHLFRTEYGKLMGILTRYFGISNFELAEDVLQDTLISALDTWSVNGIPTNPTGWLVQVAKRKAINELKRHKIIRNHQTEHHFFEEESADINPVYLENEIKDGQLRMIFACCHPSIDLKSQIALTLKTLCGFGIKEVANALLTTESTINKRLYRAKEKIRNSEIQFQIPQGADLENKLDTVGLTLYLFFNEGYNSSKGDAVIQKGLCLEAIRLTKLVVDHFTPKRISALLALMCFHTARFDARIDDKGAIILFEDQNRDLWHQELIQIGMFYLKQSLHDKALSVYHIEARIAAEHCTASSFENTNWQVIHELYTRLYQLKPNPIIQLNLAIIQSQLTGVKEALRMLEALSADESLKNYHLLPASQGNFYKKLGEFSKAVPYFEKALSLKPSPREKAFIQSQILICKTNPDHLA